jgi:hypothetical protein
MGLFRHTPRVPEEFTDAQWWANAERVYDERWRSFLGSPETFANGAGQFYLKQEFGVSALLYQKAIDLMHTLYDINSMRARQPSPRDLSILDGYLSALGASLSLHPEAPVAGSVREVTHRLRTIALACQSAGFSDSMYRQALDRLASTAPGVNIDDVLW